MTSGRPIAQAQFEAGFTLVELLVATTLLGFFTVLLFGGLRFGTRAWERSQENYADQNAVRFAQAYLAGEIARAYPRPIHSATHMMRVDFDGQAQSMTWLSASHGPSGGMTRLHAGAAVHDDGLDLVASAGAELAATAVATSQRLLGKMSAFEISYFGRRIGEKTSRWSADWQDQPRLPSLVRIRLRMMDARLVWPDLVVAPRISADASCVLDALTSDCQGR